MPNDLVFNQNAAELRTLIYGVNGDLYLPVAVDGDGKFLFSQLSVITVSAQNFDIRDLNAATDSVTVTAVNLDIRDLNGSQDSVKVSARSFVEDTVSTTLSSGTTPILTRDISPYSQNGFFIRNGGTSNIIVTLQVAPVDSATYYVSNSTAQTVPGSNNLVLPVTVAMKYARLSVTATTSTGIVAYYNGRA